jgi:hypothetical protein
VLSYGGGCECSLCTMGARRGAGGDREMLREREREGMMNIGMMKGGTSHLCTLCLALVVEGTGHNLVERWLTIG